MLKIIEAGVDVTEFSCRTPSDVRVWRKRFSNDFHDGMAESPFEIISQVTACRAQWTSHVLTHGITVSNCAKKGDFTYDKLRLAHILRHFPSFGSPETLADCYAVHDTLTAFDCFCDVQVLGEARWDFASDPFKKPSVLIGNMRDICDRIGRYSDAHSPFVLREALMQAVILMMPELESKAPHPQFAFVQLRKDLLERIDAPTSGSVLSARAVKSLAKTTSANAADAAASFDESLASAEQSTNKRQRLNIKANKSALAKLQKDSMVALTMSGTNGTRDATIFDDALSVIFTPLGGLAKSDCDITMVQTMLRHTFTFVFYGGTAMLVETGGDAGGTQAVFKYSTLRTNMRMLIVKSHTWPLLRLHGQAQNARPTDNEAALVSLLPASVSQPTAFEPAGLADVSGTQRDELELPSAKHVINTLLQDMQRQVHSSQSSP